MRKQNDKKDWLYERKSTLASKELNMSYTSYPGGYSLPFYTGVRVNIWGLALNKKLYLESVNYSSGKVNI